MWRAVLSFAAGAWARVLPWLLMLGGLGAALAAYGAAQRRAGRDQAQNESTATALRHAEVRHAVEDEVRRAGAGAADRLRDGWSRD